MKPSCNWVNQNSKDRFQVAGFPDTREIMEDNGLRFIEEIAVSSGTNLDHPRELAPSISVSVTQFVNLQVFPSLLPP